MYKRFVFVVYKLTVSRTGLFGNVTIYWRVNASDSDINTELFLLPPSGSVSLLSGLYSHVSHAILIQ